MVPNISSGTMPVNSDMWDGRNHTPQKRHPISIRGTPPDSRRTTIWWLRRILLSLVLVAFLRTASYLVIELPESSEGVYSIDSHMQPSHSLKTGPRCALLFFGVPRLFKPIVLPTIQKYILRVNPTCDVFVHTYNLTTITTTRSAETNATLNPEDVYLLGRNVAMDTMDDFHAQRNVSFFEKHHFKNWGACCESTVNMIKQWHSINGAWQLMEDHSRKMLHGRTSSQPYYDRVGLFRSDVVYTTPINITDPTEAAVLPNWSLMNQKKDTLVYNDRLFYGNYASAKVWATGRFTFAPIYLERNKQHKRGRLQGLHSETFLYYLLNEHLETNVTKKPMCFWRTRATGMIMTIDCLVPDEDGVEGKIKDPEDWALLSNFTCCWGCKGHRVKDGQWGPCTAEAQGRMQNKFTFKP